MFAQTNNLLAMLRLRDILASAMKLSVKCPNTIQDSGFIIPLSMAAMLPKMISRVSQPSANLNYSHGKEKTMCRVFSVGLLMNKEHISVLALQCYVASIDVYFAGAE